MAQRDRYFIGEAYGGSATGRTSPNTIEWEWVHVGRQWALSHPMARLHGGVLVIVAYVACWGLTWTYIAAMLPAPEAYVMSFFCGFALVALVRRSPLAWPLVWLNLLATLPVSLPFMMYWADGVRPNLIYRFRFERLVRSSQGPADAN